MAIDNLGSRMERIQAAIRLKRSDRVPVSLIMDYKFPMRYKGFTQGDYFRDMRLGEQTTREVFDELGGWDMAMSGGMTTQARNILEAPMVAKIPGRDIGEDDVIQLLEQEIFKKEDYDKIIAMGWKRFMVDFLPNFRGWNVAEYHERTAKSAEKDIMTFKANIAYWQGKGIPIIGGAYAYSPLMMLSCSRSMLEFTKDVYQDPDRVEAAMDAMVEDLIEVSIRSVKQLDIGPLTGIPVVMIVLERGGCFYYPLTVFERFELPYLKRMVEAYVAEGITPVMHFDQDWSQNLPYLKELPKGKCIAQFDNATDIFEAKEILRDHVCIMGDVPAALLTLGQPGEVTDYCKRLIDEIGDGGGFILGVACSVPVDAKFENLKAMIDAVK
ncbi:MAG: hypothetical protein JRH15_15175 [Deltaproteobacteria bacterium]|nr:hypothetical protein [Deltaproteobacteria bacterium]